MRRSAARCARPRSSRRWREPEQAVADADLLRQRNDLTIALEEVMVEALDRGARHREGVGLSAEPLSTLPERDLMPLLRQAEGGGQPVIPPPMTAMRDL